MPHATDQHITFQVYDATGQAQHVLLSVDERTAHGTLSISPIPGGASQSRELAALQKSHDGTILKCKVGIATVTFTIDATPSPPTLALVARALFPLLETTYTLSREDQQRLVAWSAALRLDVMA